jgi:hypothetical protein
MQKLISSLVFCAIALGGCSAATTQPEGKAPEIVSAEFGLFNPAASGQMAFVPSNVVPNTPNQNYGWQIALRTDKPTVKWQEEFTLPVKPSSWGEPETLGTRTISADGKTAVTTREVSPDQGVISNSWTVLSGDPKGSYVMKVSVEGVPVKTFTFTVQ